MNKEFQNDREKQERNRVDIQAGPVTLEGNLTIPAGARGIVLFAHGSGSGRFSPRNQQVAREFEKEGLATLLMDLLTEEEEAVDMFTLHYRFDIELLADRLAGTTYWINKNPSTQSLRIGYFGASTGAAAALLASARHPDLVRAVVSRGGRPDMAGPALYKVQAPTLLIVGEKDEPVIKLNRQAYTQLHTEKALEIVPNASHLFEEPGTLDVVAHLASDWFKRYLLAESIPSLQR